MEQFTKLQRVTWQYPDKTRGEGIVWGYNPKIRRLTVREYQSRFLRRIPVDWVVQPEAQ